MYVVTSILLLYMYKRSEHWLDYMARKSKNYALLICDWSNVFFGAKIHIQKAMWMLGGWRLKIHFCWRISKGYVIRFPLDGLFKGKFTGAGKFIWGIRPLHKKVRFCWRTYVLCRDLRNTSLVMNLRRKIVWITFWNVRSYNSNVMEKFNWEFFRDTL